jgi:hypothetical protein
VSSKDENYWKVLDSVVRLEVVRGHLQWKISDVSRLSGVQRTLIYYYFGKSKEGILTTALKTIGDEVFGLSAERLELWRQGKIRESVMASRQILQRAPHISEFYFHWRHQDSELKQELVKLEKRYITKLKSTFPHLTETDLKAIFVVFFATVNSADLSDAVIDRILSQVTKLSARV